MGALSASPSPTAQDWTGFGSCQHSSTADCETDGYLSSSGFLDSPDLAHRSFVAVDPTSPPPTRPVSRFPTVSTAPGPRGRGSCGTGSPHPLPAEHRRAAAHGAFAPRQWLLLLGGQVRLGGWAGAGQGVWYLGMAVLMLWSWDFLQLHVRCGIRHE